MKSKNVLRKSRPKVTCVSKRPHFKRYRMVLMMGLYENCQDYSFFPEVSQLIRESDWAGLYEWTERATTEVYSTAAEHFAVAQLVALVRKFPFSWRTLGFEMSPKEQAIETFMSAERRCKRINKLFWRIRRTPYAFKLDYMRRWIHHVLGESPDLLKVYDGCDFGPGANLGVHGNATNLYRKMFAESWTVTEAAKLYVIGALKRNNNLSLHLLDEKGGYVCFDMDVLRERIIQRFRTVSYNQLSFVPKTAKTDRSIAVEPLMNSFLQKGIDLVLRSKLLRVGYDLSDQGRNQYLAKVGSVDSSYATMDLSSASDSISVELARYLLPPAWFSLLNCARSPCYELGATKVAYEKFCSMGNGFCFPLETLIFAAAARAVMHERQDADRTHCVYGDDIVIPSDCFDNLKRLLGVIGFKVNSRKSFKTGPFRESCGADWYKGQDVRPVYVDYHLGATSSIMIFHNSTLRGNLTTAFFLNVRQYLRNQVAERYRFLRPHRKYAEVGRDSPLDVQYVLLANANGAFDVDLDTFMGSNWAKWNRDEQRWNWKEFVYTPYKDKAVGPQFERAQYLAFLRGSPGGLLALRRKTRASVISK